MLSPSIMRLVNEYTDVRAVHRSLADIIRLHAFRERETPFKLSAGGESRAYFDMKQIMFDPLALNYLAQLFNIHIRDHVEPILLANPEKYEHQDTRCPLLVGGMEMGAIPLSLMCLLTGDHSRIDRYGFFVRKEPKGHGTNASIDGIDILLIERCPILIVEDVTTTGASAMKTVEAIRKATPDPKIIGVLSILDRQEGADALFSQIGLPLHSVFVKSDFTQYA